MKISFLSVFLGCLILFSSCGKKSPTNNSNFTLSAQDEVIGSVELSQDRRCRKVINPQDIIIEKEFLYDKYTLEDVYPYKDTTRRFQWEQIREYIALIDSVQQCPSQYAVVQNRRNVNGKAPLVKESRKNDYGRASDKYGVEQYQSVPLYFPNDSTAPERYVEDGAWVKIIQENGDKMLIEPIYIEDEWIIPSKYVHKINDSTVFNKVIFVDRTNQNIATIEKSGEKWLVRSMNKATTGLHQPPLQHETPLGIFVVQQKKPKMLYYKDGTTDIGGFAPYASRFCNGAYIHGVPVNKPREEMIETSSTLGTTPRSHMCVRNATSHAKFVYDWAPIEESLVVVIE